MAIRSINISDEEVLKYLDSKENRSRYIVDLIKRDVGKGEEVDLDIKVEEVVRKLIGEWGSIVNIDDLLGIRKRV